MADDPLAQLQALIEAASPGTPSLTCRIIAEFVVNSTWLRGELAEAWDEGAREYADSHDTQGLAQANPY